MFFDSLQAIDDGCSGNSRSCCTESRRKHSYNPEFRRWSHKHGSCGVLALGDHGLDSRSRSPANAFRHRDQDGISDLVRRIRHDAMRRQLHLVRSHMQCVNNAVKAIDMLLRAEASTLPQQDLSVHMHGNMPSDSRPYTSRPGQERETHVHMEPSSPTLLEELDSDSDLTQSR